MRMLILIFIVVGIMSGPDPSMATTDLFLPHVDYQMEHGASSITAGDLNSDGKTDMATSNGFGIFLGNGDGTFQKREGSFSLEQSFSIITDDFNGDRKADLVEAYYWTNTVSVYLGNGDGTFQSKVELVTGTNPRHVVFGDFDGDGKADFATINQGASTLSVFKGNGDGTFQTRTDYGTGYGPTSGTTADFDGDKNVDLATANYLESNVTVFSGYKNGTFQVIATHGTRPGPWSITVGDFNNDGKADLATANHSNSISILIGNGDDTFKQKVDYMIGSRPYSIVAGDFNGDGKADLATANLLASTVSILIGNGDGTFQPPLDFATGQGPYGIVAGDFNGDGKTDLATTNIFGHSISILLASTPNYPPVANAGPDRIIECSGPLGAAVTLDGTGSSDPDGDALTYRWTWAGGSAEGVNPTISLPLGTTVITLTVNDGKATATDTVNINVQDTTPPATVATGGNGDWYSTNVISTFTAYDRCSGVKEIHYIVNGAETVIPGSYTTATITNDGIYNIAYFAVDSAGNVESPKGMTVKIDKTPPTISLYTTLDILWPPDHKMVDVMVGGDAFDTLSGIVSVDFNVTDEYGTVHPNISEFNTAIALEAWREGDDYDGRHYTITAVATDAAGNKSTVSTVVLVPHDQR